jgi:hypothetical protein
MIFPQLYKKGTKDTYLSNYGKKKEGLMCVGEGKRGGVSLIIIISLSSESKSKSFLSNHQSGTTINTSSLLSSSTVNCSDHTLL